MTPETPNLTAFAQTDDMRPGLGYERLQNLQRFVKNGGVYIGAVASAQFAIDFGMSKWRLVQRRESRHGHRLILEDAHRR